MKILVELPEWQYKEIKGDKGISEGVMINALCAIRLGKLVEQEPQTFKWCTDCREYDQEKHCCHRWSNVIRDTVEEMKQEYIEREVIDKIFCIVHPLSIMSTPELEHKAIMQIAEMLEPLCLPETEET